MFSIFKTRKCSAKFGWFPCSRSRCCAAFSAVVLPCPENTLGANLRQPETRKPRQTAAPAPHRHRKGGGGSWRGCSCSCPSTAKVSSLETTGLGLVGTSPSSPHVSSLQCAVPGFPFIFFLLSRLLQPAYCAVRLFFISSHREWPKKPYILARLYGSSYM